MKNVKTILFVLLLYTAVFVLQAGSPQKVWKTAEGYGSWIRNAAASWITYLVEPESLNTAVVASNTAGIPKNDDVREPPSDSASAAGSNENHKAETAEEEPTDEDPAGETEFEQKPPSAAPSQEPDKPTPAPEPQPAPTPVPAPEPKPEPEPAPEPEPETAPEPNDRPSELSLTYASKVIELVNKERKKHGISPVTLNSPLMELAWLKAKDMHDNKYFSHTSPTYGSPFDMMKDFGISYLKAAENIAAGHASPGAVVSSWMESEGHKNNILNPELTQIGVGYYKGPNGYGHYWSQLFLKPRQQ